MVTLRFKQRISYRLNPRDYERAISYLKRNPHKYDNLSHLARASLIKTLNEGEKL